MSNSVMARFNMKGKRSDKLAFPELRLYKVIIGMYDRPIYKRQLPWPWRQDTNLVVTTTHWLRINFSGCPGFQNEPRSCVSATRVTLYPSPLLEAAEIILLMSRLNPIQSNPMHAMYR
jgi:hypothetical protein